ncbi:thiamine pyrophosphate-dependent dehydrogenase E1 component subunit alpha [Streptomyces rhizosphaericus]|uniref:2-oxoisovalerate dehydrogenase subunit alpha n=1 Tax=Streptomyces rhizosphaericus TaxID=114699 RepID=A0A6G4AWI0_9ACTN|nr:thiamine pyrophosphate-dependent dehydrogenase E1 component subunit alpha [Streptomyces rhizosphaericus]NEW77622.1 thiamine pyrophosphate-dependent dehydrogenase E1 component subunit alpha [Streptomyces rhizosphaericus]
MDSSDECEDDFKLFRVLDHNGQAVADAETLESDIQLTLYRLMVLCRRLDEQATTLAKQGHLVVYPSAIGQEACQIGSVTPLRESDWLFPTYRDSMSIMARGIPPAEVLGLMQGSWHCGYDSLAYRTAPQSTPLATHLVHAVGLACAAQLAGHDAVALALCGDGATSEGDFHEALNFAAVRKAPVVFFVQNNGYAISVPLRSQTSAPTLAHKATGYGMPGYRVDGNDAMAVWTTVSRAAEMARSGKGPSLIEAVTYRIAPHTNADDPSRYRDGSEAAAWRQRDPIKRLEKHMLQNGLLNQSMIREIATASERSALDMRQNMIEHIKADPLEMFEHVMSHKTSQLSSQQALLATELDIA